MKLDRKTAQDMLKQSQWFMYRIPRLKTDMQILS